MIAADKQDVFGLIHPALDVHTLGINAVESLLTECGFRVCSADADLCAAADAPENPAGVRLVCAWIEQRAITRLGFSYRLDPHEGAQKFFRWVEHLRGHGLLREKGVGVNALYFAGLPAACELIERRFGREVVTFRGDESPGETLEKLGIPSHAYPLAAGEEAAYDRIRREFAQRLIARELHIAEKPVDDRSYPGFGTMQDRLELRLRHRGREGRLPLMRAHVGPYGPDREAALKLFLDWCRRLAESGWLDILSIGTSQLSQSRFGEDWGDSPNGGGIPVNAAEDFSRIWRASRPLLVRTYAGTQNVPALARLYEKTINIAWHALSFWWFCRLDGRGPNDLLTNLRQHFETLKFIAATRKPFEPNVPHHFAFRGADEITCVVSGVLAARAAKRAGVGQLVLQIMLNTPKHNWGIQDLAQARALLALTRELEDERFSVILQPRAGLDYLSHDLNKARIQLAAVSALMDDIEPLDQNSPEIIHVVSYCEGNRLADPDAVDESVRITAAALRHYRAQKQNGQIEDLSRSREVQRRFRAITAGAKAVLEVIERSIPNPYSPEGLYLAFQAGFLPVPYLWQDRDRFPEAVRWQTRLIKGAVRVVSQKGLEISPAERAAAAAEAARRISADGGQT